MEDNNQDQTTEEPVVDELNSQESDDTQEGDEIVDESGVPAIEAQAKAVEKKLKKLKLKVDGQEFEEEFDPEDDEYLTKQLQLAKMSQKRAAHANQIEKEVADWISNLRKNPRKVLSDPNLGVDLRKLAAEMIEEELENSKKSPEQIEREKLELELKDLKDKAKKDKEDSEKREYERLVNDNIEKYDNMITDALEKGKLPSTPYSVKKMTEYLMLAVENSLDISPYDIVNLVRDEMQQDIKQMFQVLPEDVVEQLIGKETINKIRKKNLAKAKQKPPVPMKSSIKDAGKPSQKQSEADKKSYKQFFGF